MRRSLRRSASASAAIATNSLPRWLISITDMPASCQLTSSHLAFSSTSTGMVAGPAPKLKMRATGLTLRGLAALAGFAAGRGRPAGFFLAGSALPRARAFFALVVAVAVAVFAIFVVAIEDALQARELLALGQVDERDPLRGTAHLADLVHARADEDAAGGDQHDLILGRNERRGDHLAVPLGGLDRDHALRAAPVARVLGDRRALAVAVLGRREHALALVLGHQERDHLAAFCEVHPADPAGASAHGPHVVLVEPHRLALVGEEHHVVLAVGDGHAHEPVALVQ